MFCNIAKFLFIIIINKIIFYKNNTKLYLTDNIKVDTNNKELLTISPGGIKGFYLLGIMAYIKNNYNTDNLIYSGASAGSWNSLFMCYKGDSLKLIYNMFDNNILNSKSILELEYYMKYKLLSKYKSEDFNLDRLYISVSSIDNFKITKHIFNDFQNLEDAINCCIASSHIPFITGGLINKYNNMLSFDGGLCENPYLNVKEKLHIYPNIWKEKQKKESLFMKIANCILEYSEFFSIKKNNPIKLFDDGYQDARKNKDFLDKIFTINKKN